MKSFYAKTGIVAAALVVLSAVGFGTVFGYGETPVVQLGGHRSGGASVSVSAAPGRVLGASTISLSLKANLGVGASSNDVKDLQEKLRAEGFFTFPTSTGFFGPITKAAVIAYQKAHGLPATGFVGVLTRAELSK